MVGQYPYIHGSECKTHDVGEARLEQILRARPPSLSLPMHPTFLHLCVAVSLLLSHYRAYLLHIPTSTWNPRDTAPTSTLQVICDVQFPVRRAQRQAQ